MKLKGFLMCKEQLGGRIFKEYERDNVRKIKRVVFQIKGRQSSSMDGFGFSLLFIGIK